MKNVLKKILDYFSDTRRITEENLKRNIIYLLWDNL